MADYKQLCAELIDALDSGIPSARIRSSPLANRARAALAESEVERPINWPAYFARQAAVQEQELKAALAPPEPEEPTDEELDELFTEIDQSGEPKSWLAFARAVLARWGGHHHSLFANAE